MHTIPLQFVQKKVAGGGGRSTNANLSLTSMIDFLVVTVVFLLMTFSASGETPMAKGIELPKAENTMDMIDAPIVAVNGQRMLADGAAAGNTRAIEDSKRMQRIDELFNILKNKRELWKQLHPGKDFPGVVVLQSRSGRAGGRREERVPDGGLRRLPERQLHGRPAPEDPQQLSSRGPPRWPFRRRRVRSPG